MYDLVEPVEEVPTRQKRNAIRPAMTRRLPHHGRLINRSRRLSRKRMGHPCRESVGSASREGVLNRRSSFTWGQTLRWD